MEQVCPSASQKRYNREAIWGSHLDQKASRFKDQSHQDWKEIFIHLKSKKKALKLLMSKSIEFFKLSFRLWLQEK